MADPSIQSAATSNNVRTSPSVTASSIDLSATGFNKDLVAKMITMQTIRHDLNFKRLQLYKDRLIHDGSLYGRNSIWSINQNKNFKYQGSSFRTTSLYTAYTAGLGGVYSKGVSNGF